MAKKNRRLYYSRNGTDIKEKTFFEKTRDWAIICGALTIIGGFVDYTVITPLQGRDDNNRAFVIQEVKRLDEKINILKNDTNYKLDLILRLLRNI